jgi:putative two-component system response regulator
MWKSSPADCSWAGELNEGIIRNILKAAPLHDIGKIGIPDSILLKKGKLTSEEFEIIKTHCQIGAKTLRGAINQSIVLNPNLAGESNLSSLEFLEMAEIIAKYHHEKWDGTGYPTGIRGNLIPLPARLMALADVFDALTTVRPYKNNWSFEDASEFIRRQNGFHFDPDIIEAFEQEQIAFAETLKLLQDDRTGDNANA